jgi:hypothetical protein
MKLAAVVIILRKDQVFDLAGALVHRNYGGFTGFPHSQVPAAYRADRPVDGYGVGVTLQPSQADTDFGCPIVFLTENDVCDLIDAFVQSDELTQKLLGRGWTRPSPEGEEVVLKVVLRLLEVSPDFGHKLAKRVEAKSKRLWKLIQEYNSAKLEKEVSA